MLDLKDPVVLRFIERLVVLPAAEWDAIEARMRALSKARYEKSPPPRNPRLENFIARTFNILKPTDEMLERIGHAVMGMGEKSLRGMLAPRWRTHGTGPIRRLTETLALPYVDRTVRLHVLLTLLNMEHRGRTPKLKNHPSPAENLRELYAAFEPVIPWASLVPPLLPGATAPPESS
jgi:hypothetical protein